MRNTIISMCVFSSINIFVNDKVLVKKKKVKPHGRTQGCTHARTTIKIGTPKILISYVVVPLEHPPKLF
jgi:hypothetical protein